MRYPLLFEVDVRQCHSCDPPPLVFAVSLRGRGFGVVCAMGKKHLSDDVKRRIRELRDQGKSYSEIGTALQLAKSTVALWVQRSRSLPPGTVPATRKQAGRARITSPTTDRMLRRTVIEYPSISARELRNENPDTLGNVSIRTIQHRLKKDLNLPARRPAAKPLLTKKMKAKRVAFCKRYPSRTCGM